MLTERWNWISNGKVAKGFSSNNAKVLAEIKQNEVYSKNQVKIILEQIKAVNGLKSTNDGYKKLKIWESLDVLG